MNTDKGKRSPDTCYQVMINDEEYFKTDSLKDARQEAEKLHSYNEKNGIFNPIIVLKSRIVTKVMNIYGQDDEENYDMTF